MTKVVHIEAEALPKKSGLPVSAVYPRPESKERESLASVRANMKYKLQDLVDECDPNQPLSEEDSAWLNDPPVGREVL